MNDKVNPLDGVVGEITEATEHIQYQAGLVASIQADPDEAVSVLRRAVGALTVLMEFLGKYGEQGQ